MAKNTTSGPNNVVTDVSGSYDVSEMDDVISIAANWAGGVLTLPGPLTGHLPNSGDEYTIADPQNVVATSGNHVTINGGGYKFLANGAMVTQVTLTTIVPSTYSGIAQTAIGFTFDGVQGVWIPSGSCAGAPAPG